MGALTKRHRRHVEEEEARARGLIADIVPLLNELPEHEIATVSEHLEKALKAAKAATDRLKSADPEKQNQ